MNYTYIYVCLERKKNREEGEKGERNEGLNI